MDNLVRPGGEISRERTARRVPRHHHLAPYAAIVLRGSYVEAGDRGRFRVEAGDVLLHDRFEAHGDTFGAAGADILNLPCPEGLGAASGRIEDPDRIVRVAERDPAAAAEELIAGLVPGGRRLDDWPDLLAAELDRDRVRSLADWAESHGLAPASLSRGFASAYGVSPKRYRAERRASRAAQAIASGGAGPLVMLALDLGFADQSHMSREVVRLTGLAPRRLAPRPPPRVGARG
jgi:AraC-like DNA-binding protein